MRISYHVQYLCTFLGRVRGAYLKEGNYLKLGANSTIIIMVLILSNYINK